MPPAPAFTGFSLFLKDLVHNFVVHCGKGCEMMGYTVFLAEDDLRLRGELSALLERYGYRCLFPASYEDLAGQILDEQSLESVTCQEDQKYTPSMLLKAIDQALSKARIDSSGS